MVKEKTKQFIRRTFEFILLVILIGVNVYWLITFKEFAEVFLYLIGGATFFFGIFWAWKELIIKDLWEEEK